MGSGCAYYWRLRKRREKEQRAISTLLDVLRKLNIRSTQYIESSVLRSQKEEGIS